MYDNRKNGRLEKNRPDQIDKKLNCQCTAVQGRIEKDMIEFIKMKHHSIESNRSEQNRKKQNRL